MYCIVLKVSVLGLIHLKSVEFLWKIFERLRVCTQNSWKVFVLDLKHLKSIEFQNKTFEICFWFLCKTSEKFRICIQNIQNLFGFFPKHLKSIECHPKKLKSISFISKIFKIKIYFWYRHFGPKDTRNIEFLCQTFDKSRIL